LDQAEVVHSRSQKTVVCETAPGLGKEIDPSRRARCRAQGFPFAFGYKHSRAKLWSVSSNSCSYSRYEGGLHKCQFCYLGKAAWHVLSRGLVMPLYGIQHDNSASLRCRLTFRCVSMLSESSLVKLGNGYFRLFPSSVPRAS
jgi:hypothetical protein